MFKIWRLSVAAVAILSLVATASAQYPFKVIVRSDHPANAIRRRELGDVFLGKRAKWGDGQRILPVDQSIHSKVRGAFVWEVLGQSAEAVEQYWRRQLMSGGYRPPPVKDTDAKVIAYVSAQPGTIGYVLADTELPEGVMVLRILE
jgi:ABC-type phosphate transport system substrate-binding protein